ncbi:MAG TPA: hypothetical protein DCL54_10395 [Alphaproteobacteria bacterium]|nr:hypothetical protein [Alphaproteobacteria bacterium]HAJ46977.1 hypothetical protein [Alphaproteobacteria bacterium]
MAQILIRNLDPAIVDALRQRAKQAGSSLEEEARRALALATGLGRAAAVARLNEVRAQIGRRKGPSGLDDLRADRNRDDGRSLRRKS